MYFLRKSRTSDKLRNQYVLMWPTFDEALYDAAKLGKEVFELLGCRRFGQSADEELP